VIDPTVIEKQLIAIAYLYSTLKNTITKGITIPPPPIPATIAIGMIKANKIDPAISISVRGKASFQSQKD
jgi:hypothetical protein